MFSLRFSDIMFSKEFVDVARITVPVFMEGNRELSTEVACRVVIWACLQNIKDKIQTYKKKPSLFKSILRSVGYH